MQLSLKLAYEQKIIKSFNGMGKSGGIKNFFHNTLMEICNLTLEEKNEIKRICIEAGVVHEIFESGVNGWILPGDVQHVEEVLAEARVNSKPINGHKLTLVALVLRYLNAEWPRMNRLRWHKQTCEQKYLNTEKRVRKYAETKFKSKPNYFIENWVKSNPDVVELKTQLEKAEATWSLAIKTSIKSI